ncbi:increased DNA methylation 1-like isoform X2 [Rutidosis leptorrhynchoides]|uniref:increased DNA methylation 1-like isoform X2 n=1 Tax=Rutidosis leptorrhynchoides TaxID=125765 RepID=UPI003A99C1BD
MDMELQENQSQPKMMTTSSRLFGKPRKSLAESSLSQLKLKGAILKKASNKHHMLFEEAGLRDGTPLIYHSHGKILSVGLKKGRGIWCSCCNNEVSPSLFEAHAGKPTRKKPYENIFLSNGMSLDVYSSSLKPICELRRQKKNDRICAICGEERGKASCARCLKSFQDGIQIDGRRVRIVENLNRNDQIDQIDRKDQNDRGDVVACVLCRQCDFSKKGFNDRTVIICNQCEKEYHVGCLSQHNMAKLEELPRGNWFCDVACERLYNVVKGFVVCCPERVPDFIIDLVRRKLKDDVTESNVKWTVFPCKHAPQNYKILRHEAVNIFHDRFSPVIDSITKNDIIRSMAYGRRSNTSDFSGVLCAVLTINSKVVTAGMFRILGHEVAEFPIVATSQSQEGKRKMPNPCG